MGEVPLFPAATTHYLRACRAYLPAWKRHPSNRWNTAFLESRYLPAALLRCFCLLLPPATPVFWLRSSVCSAPFSYLLEHVLPAFTTLPADCHLPPRLLDYCSAYPAILPGVVTASLRVTPPARGTTVVCVTLIQWELPPPLGTIPHRVVCYRCAGTCLFLRRILRYRYHRYYRLLGTGADMGTGWRWEVPGNCRYLQIPWDCCSCLPLPCTATCCACLPHYLHACLGFTVTCLNRLLRTPAAGRCTAHRLPACLLGVQIPAAGTLELPACLPAWHLPRSPPQVPATSEPACRYLPPQRLPPPAWVPGWGCILPVHLPLHSITGEITTWDFTSAWEDAGRPRQYG